MKGFASVLLSLILAVGTVGGGGAWTRSAAAVAVGSAAPPMMESDGVPLGAQELRAIAAARPANAAELVDTDGDGLPDVWETNGADFNGDGVIDLPLNKMGADPKIPDIFVEVDWMSGMHDNESYVYYKGNTVKKTNQQMFDLTAAEFAAHGIRLHIDFGVGSVDSVTGKNWDSYPGGSGGNAFPYSTDVIFSEHTDNSTWLALSQKHLSYLRTPVFHHAMLVNTDSIGGAGGWGSMPGTRTLIYSASVFMHELGHNLGLGHGGGDSVNYKPNYISTMKYGDNNDNFAFSEQQLPDLDEHKLSEPVGIDPKSLTLSLGTAGKSFFYRAGTSVALAAIAGAPVDYNGDGDTLDTDLQQDLNNDGELTILTGHKDWGNLQLNSAPVGSLSGLDLHTITYNANGGTGAPTSQQKLKSQAVTLRTAVPTRTRCTFQGWATSPTGAVAYASGAKFTAEAHTTLYAVWMPVSGEYFVTYDKNNDGASFSGTPKDVTKSGKIALSTTVPFSDGASRKNFVGWAKSKTATTAQYLPGETLTLTGNVTLYGVWATPQTAKMNAPLSLSFQYPQQEIWIHLGTGHGTDEKVIIASAINALLQVKLYPSGSYYGAGEWNPKSCWETYLSPTTDHWLLLSSAETDRTRIWDTKLVLTRKNQYAVSYFANGGTGAPAPQIKTSGVPLTLSKTVPTRADYVFQGWAYAPTDTVGFVQPGQQHNYDYPYNLHAVWTPQTFVVKFDSCGGTAAASRTVTTKKAIGTLPSPTRAGYTFKGWYTAKTGGTKINKDTKITKNQTLYAQWTAKKYTVTYAANGGKIGTATSAKKSVSYAAKYVLPTAPKRTGYKFAGWYTAKTGGTKVTASTVVKLSKNQTLYAHWTANKYTVTFNANGGTAVKAKTIPYNTAVGALPTPTRKGYKFSGWYTAKSGGTKISKTTKITKAVTYTAHWTKK